MGLVSGGIRETLEEAGIQIVIKSILDVSLTNALRVIYLAHPVEGSNETSKTVPDFESAGAIWVSADNTTAKLTPSHCRSGRATEPLIWFPKIADGKQGLANLPPLLDPRHCQPPRLRRCPPQKPPQQIHCLWTRVFGDCHLMLAVAMLLDHPFPPC